MERAGKKRYKAQGLSQIEHLGLYVIQLHLTEVMVLHRKCKILCPECVAVGGYAYAS